MKIFTKHEVLFVDDELIRGAVDMSVESYTDPMYITLDVDQIIQLRDHLNKLLDATEKS